MLKYIEICIQEGIALKAQKEIVKNCEKMVPPLGPSLTNQKIMPPHPL